MRSINFVENPENNYATVTLELNVPIVKMDRELTDDEFKEIEKRQKARAADLLGSFASRLIASLQRRMDACLTIMLSHARDFYSPAYKCIQWDRKDGSHNYFNVESYNEMLNCEKALRMGEFNSVLKNAFWVDQILKALLNDPVEFQDHSDAGGFRYSELVSLLCEVHVFGQR